MDLTVSNTIGQRRRSVVASLALTAAGAVVSEASSRDHGVTFVVGRVAASNFANEPERQVARGSLGHGAHSVRSQAGASVAVASTLAAVAGFAQARSRHSGRNNIADARSSTIALAATKKKKDADVEEKTFSGAKRRVERLFKSGKKKYLGPNCWYESPDMLTTGKKRVWDYWQIRPTRTIEKICDGKSSCGCTWSQLDGTRGVSYFRFNQDGEVTFIREVPETGTKADSNSIQTLKPILGVMGGIAGVLNTFDGYLEIFDKDKDALSPKRGLGRPRSPRAEDVVSYLFEEAQFQPDEELIIDCTNKQYAEDAVFEDLTVKDEAWPRGKEAIRKFQTDTKQASPDGPNGLRFVLDEITDGDRSCTCIWHVEVYGSKTPRGISFYELDEEGKVLYCRQSYNLQF